jgi:hypothetical protein
VAGKLCGDLSGNLEGVSAGKRCLEFHRFHDFDTPLGTELAAVEIDADLEPFYIQAFIMVSNAAGEDERAAKTRGRMKS